jgi:hypothetical protein
LLPYCVKSTVKDRDNRRVLRISVCLSPHNFHSLTFACEKKVLKRSQKSCIKHQSIIIGRPSRFSNGCVVGGAIEKCSQRYI